MTGTQRFVREVAEMLRPGAGSAVMRAAYDAGEVPRSAPLELAAYYGLADRATGWAGAALRKLGLSDYADFLAARPIVDAYGADEAEQVLRNARFILENERFPVVYDAFLLKARTTLAETQKVVNLAARIQDPQEERQQVRLGTAAAARAFVAAWGFFGSAPEEARATAQAMRASR
jgi:hypothetical protein